MLLFSVLKGELLFVDGSFIITDCKLTHMNHCEVGKIPVLSGSICRSVAVFYHPPDTEYELNDLCTY